MKALAGRAAAILERLGVLRTLEALDRSDEHVAILTYHRVDDPDADPDLDPGLVSATPSEFQAQMEWIAQSRNVVSLAELLEAAEGARRLPRGAVVLTFDDGYGDFEAHAWPVLRRLGLPALLFVPTDYPDRRDRGFWWDRLHAALQRTRLSALDLAGRGPLSLEGPAARRAAHRALRGRIKALPHAEAMTLVEDVIGRLVEDRSSRSRVLGWDALRRLAREGLAVCAHGASHALFDRLEPSALEAELRISRARLERELGIDASPPVLAYPANGCDDQVRRAVGAAGYRLGFGGRRGVERLPFASPLELMRLPVLRYPRALFRAQLRPIVSLAGRALRERRA